MSEQLQSTEPATVSWAPAPLTVEVNAPTVTTETQHADEEERKRQEFDTLLADLARETAHRKRKGRKVIGALIVLPCLLCCLTWTALALFTDPADLDDVVPLGIIVPEIAGVFSIIIAAIVLSSQKFNKLRIVAQSDDVRAVPLLTEALFLVGTASHQASVEAALTRLLPQLKASDATLLNNEQRANLTRYLNTKMVTQANRKFVRAILIALSQVGGSQSIPAVERLARRRRGDYEFAEVRQAARDCLLFLRAEEAKALPSQTLLRASDRNSAPSEDLLRAVTTSADSQPDLLLRATASPGEE